MNKIKGQVRQGDILFLPEQKLPEGAVPAKLASKNGPKTGEQGCVVAEGEATGHAHVVVGAEPYLADGNLYTASDADARVEHDEHGPLPLTPVSRVVRQREYSPEAIRNVAD